MQNINNLQVGRKNPILRGYAAFNDRDWQAMEALLDAEVVWHRMDDPRDANPIRGRAAVIAHLMELRDTTEAEFLGVAIHGNTAITVDYSWVIPEEGSHACADKVVLNGDVITEVWHCNAGSHPPHENPES